MQPRNNKVVLVVIDALSSRTVRPALSDGKLPHLNRLIELGQVAWDCVSVFPSITPAATASLCTGQYPAQHRIVGAYWYDRDSDRVHYFGDDFWVILNRRFHNFFHDFIGSLNGEHLAAETIFQRLEPQGRSCASVNFLIYRGQQEHRARVPWLMRLWPGIPWSFSVQGPESLFLGDFVADGLSSQAEAHYKASGGPWHRYGFTDRSTAQYLLQLASHGLPDFTLAYFPDNDYDCHSVGPQIAVRTIEQFDQYLGELAGVWGGMENMLQEVTFVITGDHSQSDIDNDSGRAGIDLQELLSEHEVVPAGQSWRDGDELMVCTNLRAAQIYLRKGYQLRPEPVIRRLLEEPRVDQVIARQDTDTEGGRWYAVHTADRGSLEFRPARPGEQGVSDNYGMRWQLKGSPEAVGAEVDADNRLRCTRYPNALERIFLGFDARLTGNLWVTARPGHEFQLPENAVHNGGGSHGSLHQLDSIVPLILSIPAAERALPIHPRIVDVAPLCLSLLGQACELGIGTSRAAEKSP